MIGRDRRRRSAQVDGQEDLGFQSLASGLKDGPDRAAARSTSEVGDCQKASETPSSQTYRVARPPRPTPVRPVRGTPLRNVQPEDACPWRFGPARRCGTGSRPRLTSRVGPPCHSAAKGVLLPLEFRSETAPDSTQIKS